jgi:hypothetical protein
LTVTGLLFFCRPSGQFFYTHAMKRCVQRRVFAVLYAVAVIWTVWPIACVASANLIASVLHCRLSEGGPSPCTFLGTDISRQLYVLALSFWYALTTLPTGIPAIVLVAVVHCVMSFAARRGAADRRRT